MSFVVNSEVEAATQEDTPRVSLFSLQQDRGMGVALPNPTRGPSAAAARSPAHQTADRSPLEAAMSFVINSEVEAATHEETPRVSLFSLQQDRDMEARAGLNANLVYAAKSGDLDLMVVLINMGADTNAKNDLGCTALFAAVRRDHEHCAAIIRLLLQSQADPLAKSSLLDRTPLHLAAMNGNASAIQVRPSSMHVQGSQVDPSFTE
jgi:ankyrin repeat protein